MPASECANTIGLVPFVLCRDSESRFESGWGSTTRPRHGSRAKPLPLPGTLYVLFPTTTAECYSHSRSRRPLRQHPISPWPQTGRCTQRNRLSWNASLPDAVSSRRQGETERDPRVAPPARQRSMPSTRSSALRPCLEGNPVREVTEAARQLLLDAEAVELA